MRILALDTATENCSAALLVDGRLTVRERRQPRGHAELILAMVDEVLREAGARLEDLSALAFGRGPGSFTGVRLAASVAQGLAHGAGLRVIPVSDLGAVAQRALGEDAALARVLVCNDARMREVYWACFSRGAGGLAEPVGAERVSDPGRVALPPEWSVGPKPVGAGNGFAAYPELRTAWSGALTALREVEPRAAEIALLAVPEALAGRLLDPEQALPVYVRDDVARPQSSGH
ncbi:MAG TPA: tRNA (adenosine(37)-N6)-threonylcarbamoyltransferase complex dimerization subunit type 1 TsaB [Steroidobacteraceae bacterium]|jgi:tRNA threonylcarbamoyladenosine biosynthesis protein TsaB|nr:tRNA (adenosine(37)-N6)-threonylcarbamoyltransferase complex dimerization subunit type 1 TsaB [Steroidobacteraceae bacterium]